MNEQDYELLSQYLDDELRGSAAQALRERLMAEPQLRAQLERMRNVNSTISEAFEFSGSDAAPQHVVDMLGNAAARRQRHPAWGFAIAASLVAATGLLLAPDWRQASESHLPGDEVLAQLLERAPSRAEGWEALPDGSQFRPLLSFQSNSGQWCREYQLSSAGETWRGVACREQDAWGTAVLQSDILTESTSEYRPAGASNPDDVASFIDSHAADIPLSLEQEAQLISRNWQ